MDKQITVAVPEERVPEFYIWFAHFLAGEGRAGEPRRSRGPWRAPGPHPARPWTSDDGDAAEWLYERLSPPARRMADLLIDSPGQPISGNALASTLALDKGAHGVAGILAWPGRWCRKIGMAFPIATEAREDGGTDFSMAADTARVFAAARRRREGEGERAGQAESASSAESPPASRASPRSWKA